MRQTIKLAVLGLAVLGSLHLGATARAGDDVIVDFGAGPGLGIYAYLDESSWTRLHGLSPAAFWTGDLDCDGQDQLIVDFGPPFGLYIRDYDEGWTRLHGLSPEEIVVGDLDGNRCDELIVDFGPGSGGGIWIYYNNSFWNRLHGFSPQQMVVGDMDGNGVKDLVVDFGAGPGLGIYIWSGENGWTRLHAFSPENMVVLEADALDINALVVNFGALGVWIFDPTAGWAKLHSLSPELLAAGDLGGDGIDELIVDFGAGIGIYVWTASPSGASWSFLHSGSPAAMETGDVDDNGQAELIVVFESGQGPTGLRVYWNGSSWTTLHGLNPQDFTVGDINLSLSCRELLFSAYFLEADDCFAAALGVDPDDDEANFFRAITRILRIAEEQVDGGDPTSFTDSFKEMLDEFGVPMVGRSLFNFTAPFPEPLLSTSPTTGDIQEFFETVLISELTAAIANVQSIDSSFSLEIPQEELALIDAAITEAIEIDFGEVKALEAALSAMKAVLSTFMLAWDGNVDLDQLALMDPVRLQADLIDPHPDLFTLRPTGAALLADAKTAAQEAIDAYVAGSNFIRNLDDPDQTDDLIIIEPLDLADELDLRTRLAQTYCSMNGQALLTVTDTVITCDPAGDASINGQAIDFGALFDPPFDLRDKLPTFQYDAGCDLDYIEATTPTLTSPFPDPTINGVLPDATQQQLVDSLKLQGALGHWAQADIFAPAGECSLGYAFVWKEGEFARPIQITDVGFETGTLFQVTFLQPTLPTDLCDYGDGVWIEYQFCPTTTGAFGDTLIVGGDLPDLRIDVVGNAAKSASGVGPGGKAEDASEAGTPREREPEALRSDRAGR